MKKRILWFSNVPFSEFPQKGTGTWLSAMAKGVLSTGEVDLTVVSQGRVKGCERRDCGNIRQYLVPYERLRNTGLPPQKTVQAIQQVVDELKPDLTHVWGTENYWGLLTVRGLLQGPALLDMQGLKYHYAKVYYGGLTIRELFKCVGVLEVLRPKSSPFLAKRGFYKWGAFEKEIIKGHKYISTQSDWVRTRVQHISPESMIFNTGILLRQEFYDSKPWRVACSKSKSGPVIFTSSSSSTTYKGLHVAVRALAILKKKYPRSILQIAGGQSRRGIRESGYTKWLKKEVVKLGVSDNVEWLGPLTGAEIVECIQKSSLVVIPSFVETYCLAGAEAMAVGAPMVISYAGALPELARDGESALFFPVGDEMVCASQMQKLISDFSLSQSVSAAARTVGLKRNKPATVIERQMEIYRRVINDAKCKL